MSNETALFCEAVLRIGRREVKATVPNNVRLTIRTEP